MKLSIAYGVCAAFLFNPEAYGQKKALQAIVVSDGAAVYEKPDFDSKVIDFIQFNTTVTISRRTFAGTEGLGLFHKVRVRGKLGFIPDTDIKVVERDRDAETPAAEDKETKKVKVSSDKPKSKAFEKDDDEDPGKMPLYLTRYLGVAGSRVRFTEKFSGRKLSDQITMYGLRMTGPGTLFDGPPLDVNFWFSLDKPEYYNIFSTGINGFLLFGDVMAMLPLINGENWVVSYGLGVMWTFTRYRVQIRGENTDSLEFRLGLDLGAGIGMRIGKAYMVRADAKYYFERTQYMGYLLSLQREY